MNETNKTVAILSEIVKHFPGEHDQSSHAGKTSVAQARNVKLSHVTVDQLGKTIRAAGGKITSRESTVGASKMWIGSIKLSALEEGLKRSKVSFKIRNDEFDGRTIQGKNFEIHRLGAEEGGGLIASVYKPGKSGYEYRMGLDV